MLIDRGHTVLAGQYEDAWFDTGTLDSFLETSAYLAKGENLIEGTVEGEIGENVVVGPGAVVKCQSITNSVVLPNAQVTVDGSIKESILAGPVSAAGDVERQIIHGDYVG